jgi:hypothetical protein
MGVYRHFHSSYHGSKNHFFIHVLQVHTAGRDTPVLRDHTAPSPELFVCEPAFIPEKGTGNNPMDSCSRSENHLVQEPYLQEKRLAVCSDEGGSIRNGD